MSSERRKLPAVQLADSPRDRVIAEWIDQTISSRRGVYSETVKDILYRFITSGQRENTDEQTIMGEIARLTTQISQLQAMLASGGFSQATSDPVEEDTEAQILEKLGRMGT